jgi:type II secretory pathway component HofQ
MKNTSIPAALALLLCAATVPAAAQEFDSFAEDAEAPVVEAAAAEEAAEAVADAEDPMEALGLEIEEPAAEADEEPSEAVDETEAADETEPAPAVEETVVVEVPDGEVAEPEPEPAEEVAETPAQTFDDNGDPRVSMAFEQSTLEDVVAAFRTQTGANIVNGWTNQFTQLVSVRLDDVPWRQGLASILVPFNLQLREEPRGSHIYIVAEPRHTAPPRFTEALELKHLEAPEVAKLFAGILPKDCLVYGEPSANVVIVKATDDQINECKAILAKIDKPSPQVYIEARFVRLSAGASKKLGLKWDSLENFGVSLSHLSGGFSMSDGKLSTFGIQNDARVSSAAVGDTFSHSTLDDVESRSRTLTRETASAVSSGSYRTTANSTVSDDSVSITLNDSTLANLTANDLGYRRTAGFGGQLSVTDFGLVMSAFEQLDGAQVFSNPKIIVRNGKTAVVDMTTKYPNIKIDYQQSTESGQRDSISSSLATIPGKTIPWVGEAFFSYGITLEVTPTVSPNGLITVEIIPTISERAGTKTVYVTSDSSIGNDYPIIALRRLDTKFTMEDGKTAVIGGLTETSEKTVDSGIPLLRHIPWIGPRLFGWKSREKSQDEILVFVTVRVADPATEVVDGLPKNAVLGKMMMDGRIKEPGDRTDNEMWDLESKPVGYSIK